MSATIRSQVNDNVRNYTVVEERDDELVYRCIGNKSEREQCEKTKVFEKENAPLYWLCHFHDDQKEVIKSVVEPECPRIGFKLTKVSDGWWFCRGCGSFYQGHEVYL